MQWLLQDFEDTRNLAEALDRRGVAYSWHKVVPFVGDLLPEPVVHDERNVVLFGSYTLWRYAQKKGYRPGVFRVRPFIDEAVWHPYLLNGADAVRVRLCDVAKTIQPGDQMWFVRPVEDSKEVPGRVLSADDIIAMAAKVLALPEEELPRGSLRHDTWMMLTPPRRIQKEWRVWVVGDVVVAWSLYKEGTRVVYRREIDDDAKDFAVDMIGVNPGYARAYVMDICRTPEGLRLLETNCINAAGFYAADMDAIVGAIEGLTGATPRE